MVDRRSFLKLTLLFGLGGTALAAPVLTGQGRGNGHAKGKALICLKPTEAGKSTLRIYDWDTGDSKDVDVPLGLIHSVVQDRTNPNLLYVFEIFGSCVRMDLSNGSILKMDHQTSPVLFNGHGALSSSSEFMACTEVTGGK